MAANPGGLTSKVGDYPRRSIIDIQGVPVIPTVSAVSTAFKNLVAGSGLLIGFRATPGSGDDIVASERLANGFASVAQVGVDSAVSFDMSTAVTRVDVVGLMTGTATGGCMDTAGNSADALAQLTTFDFGTAVNRIVISITPSFTSGSEGQILVAGYVL